ncbi:mammalian cell entry protein [Mycobacterium riyadhense]|uniref:Mammalian cell entry protein n=1 Tax=Mycobacterium riyadhense TaxID=486698 RepID=A0A1X2BP87_9MYCO|nr:mammalian cell entry protein [Mycobacterium riyadhense]MCV7144344.1 mammalian cell entry protein [Mycobacterium riyadhense]ORW65009.1 mammalian cell entry protein [Mycobacterium riyadhense]
MDPVVAEQQSTTQRVRRRASRAAGPAKTESGASSAAPVAVQVPPEAQAGLKAEFKGEAKPKAKSAKRLTTLRPPPRRPAHRTLVGWITAAGGLLVVVALAVGVTVLALQQRKADAEQAREQRFVDTATQTVVNMFSYTPDTIDESVNRFVNGTSGPLRGMLSANNNVDNLKGLFRSTNATSEAVVNGAALEGIDAVSDNASVLVSVRVTVADIDGVNKPSMPYRLRVIVHEDEAGHMTGYDLKYPDGGN